MKASANGAPRRDGVTAIHSLDRFVFTVPALDEAERFYTEFGLEVRRSRGRIDLHTFGNPHCWGSIVEAPGPKRLQYLCFGAYQQDLASLARAGFAARRAGARLRPAVPGHRGSAGAVRPE